MTAFTQQWVAESLDVTALTPDDREAVVEGIGQLYQVAGLAPPEQVVWVRSPVELDAVQRDQARIRRARGRAIRRAGLRAEKPGLVRMVAKDLLIALPLFALALGLVLLPVLFRADPDSLVGEHPWTRLIFILLCLGVAAIPFTAGVVIVLVARDLVGYRREAQLHDIGSRLGDAACAAIRNRPGTRTDDEIHRIWARFDTFWGVFWYARPRPDRWQYPVFHRDGFLSGRLFGPLVTRMDLGTLALERDEGSREVSEQGATVLQAALAVRKAFGWTPYLGLVIICEPPRELQLEWVADEPRLHAERGPAVVWNDEAGTGEYFRHGERVPAPP